MSEKFKSESQSFATTQDADLIQIDTNEPFEFHTGEILGLEYLSGTTVMEMLEFNDDEMNKYLSKRTPGFPRRHCLDDEDFWVKDDIVAWAEKHGRKIC